jgi:hypothetical protein
MNVSYLVLCSPDKVIDTGVVLLEKSGMVIVDRSVVRRLSLILFSSITVISKFTECWNDSHIQLVIYLLLVTCKQC